MPNKRAADNYLTHDNWDDNDEENEEDKLQGFVEASAEVLKTRNIIKARRKTASKPAVPAEKPNLFQSFSFNTNTNNPPKLPTFSFNQQPDANKTTKSDSSFDKNPTAISFNATTTLPLSSISTNTILSTTSNFTPASQNLTNTASKILSTLDKPHLSNTVTFTKKQGNLDKSITSTASKDEFQRLNEELLEWVQECISKDPCCILTPIFNDYNNYIKDLGVSVDGKDLIDAGSAMKDAGGEGAKKGGGVKNGGGSGGGKDGGAKIDGTGSGKKDGGGNDGKKDVAFGGKKDESETQAEKSITKSVESRKGVDEGKEADKVVSSTDTNQAASLFTFATKTNDANITNATPFSFGSKAPGQTSLFGSNLFAASGNAPSSSIFSQGFFTKPPATATTEAATDGDTEGAYEPPKVESIENTEEGAYHTVKCKLYYKLEGAFKDRGVGFLHLKPNNNKTQLIIRTDTALGNILLNINVDKNMPISRQGSNNVTMVMVPNPPVDPKKPSTTPLCALFRVKTAKDADELHRLLIEAQNKL